MYPIWTALAQALDLPNATFDYIPEEYWDLPRASWHTIHDIIRTILNIPTASNPTQGQTLAESYRTLPQSPFEQTSTQPNPTQTLTITPLQHAIAANIPFIAEQIDTNALITPYQHPRNHVPDSTTPPTSQEIHEAMADSLNLPSGTFHKYALESTTWTQLRSFLADLNSFEHFRNNGTSHILPGLPSQSDIPTTPGQSSSSNNRPSPILDTGSSVQLVNTNYTINHTQTRLNLPLQEQHCKTQLQIACHS